MRFIVDKWSRSKELRIPFNNIQDIPRRASLGQPHQPTAPTADNRVIQPEDLGKPHTNTATGKKHLWIY